jgi:hypothetical protein
LILLQSPVHREPMHPRFLALLLGLLALTEWRGVGDEGPRPLFVEGYSGQVSYAPGDELTLHVSTSAAKFSVEIVRLGAQAESVWTSDNLNGREFPIPEDASSHGCRWPSAWSLKIPATWRSGYYQVAFRARDNGGKYVQRNARTATGQCYFILRSATPGTASRVLLQFATHTYNAYNNWGGFSLYAYHGRGGNQGHRVSYERPPSSLFGNWEQSFVEWAERRLCAGICRQRGSRIPPEMLASYKLVLSVGHDEYWSAPMRDNLEAFIGEGGNVAFFSGNTCCWQVRSEDGGRP